MEKLTEQQIEKINKSLKDSWNQGIYKEPYGVEHEKDYVIYQRHERGGVSGGSCWDSSDPQPYYNDEDRPNWDALDEVMWNSIADIKFNVMKDTLTKKSLFTQIKEALEVKDYARASNLQLELKANMEEIQQLYVRYKKNIY